jgi:acetoin utilization protein AcuB
MRALPTVKQFMTPAPQTIGVDMTLSVAHRMMRERRVRHLPVLEEDKLVGIVSQRDLALVETLRDVDPDRVTVGEAMTPDPFRVTPETPLVEVVRDMADHKYGAAVVIENDVVVGIFTTVDALHAMLLLVGRRGAAAQRRERARHAG